MPAAAAQITAVDWTITSGTFGAGTATGPIAGGSLRWVPAAGTVSTPASKIPGTAYLTLTGPSGFVRFTHNGIAVDEATLRPYRFIFLTAGKTAQIYSGVSTSNFSTRSFASLRFGGIKYGYAAYGGTLRDQATQTMDGAGHNFIPGSEVRTTVPEPVAASLLAAGLAGLTSLAGGRAAITRRRRRQRR